MTDTTLPQDAWLAEAERLIEEFGFACMAADSDEDVTQSCAALLAHILARPASPAVPPGWKLVPIEPTQAMYEAWDFAAGYRYTRAAVWRDILAASPPAPAAQPAVPGDAEALCWSLRQFVRMVPAGDAACWVRFKVGAQEFTIGNEPMPEDEAAHFAGLFVLALAGAFRLAPTAAVRPADEREAFEAWAYTKDWRNFSREGSQYCIGQLNSLWHGWQARAALSVRPSNDIADDIPGSTAAGDVDTTAALTDDALLRFAIERYRGEFNEAVMIDFMRELLTHVAGVASDSKASAEERNNTVGKGRASGA